MSEFTHHFCDPCWRVTHGQRIPYRVIDAADDVCCYCGRESSSGIYVREDPSLLPCRGEH